MANRRFYQFRLSLEPQVADLFLSATFGAAGAVTLNAAQSRGIASMVKDGTGTYTITLQDTYSRLLMVSKTNISSSAPASPDMRLYNDDVSDSTTPSLAVVFSIGGVDTNPASGESINMQISLKNSSV